MAHVFVDILIAEQMYQHDLDSLNLVVQSVYEKYSITKEIYDNQINGFSSDAEQWEEFFDLAQSYLDSLKIKGSDAEF